MNTASESQAIATTEPAKFDELMLAMDVVDTLRHQQDLVDHALAEDARDAALIAKIKSIYADQGIEVSDAIIAEGVEALKKDRFVYQPPATSLSVRLARLYVDRGKWAKRLIAVGVLGLAGWLVYDIQSDFAQRSRTATAREHIETFHSRVEGLNQRLAQVQRTWEAAQVPADAQAAGQRLLSDARVDIGRAEQVLSQVKASIGSLPDPATVSDPATVEHAIVPWTAPLDEAEQALVRADGMLGDLRQMGDLADLLARARSQLAGAMLSPAVRSDVDTVQQQAEQALAAGDLPLARGRIDRLAAMAATVNQTYELRIVSRPGAQSGVWRHPADNPGARNYYIIVEAIGPDGRLVELPITSEEDQSTRQVSTFGIRVPERVYDVVRADKQDNGLIDAPLFGEKHRGELEPRYRHAVAGGMITSW